ncbi:hypothetical protein P8917_00895 [Bacillus atrophaeus]|uniref:phage baseplate plug family protein n=1 Tax=Bacillus subtilis group TaxID=653685 RepID=UPI0022807FF6|nr:MULTISPECIES: hypothetical protein [Bacillus subtilis group]MCY7919563.1 hypothetical protein [Bacillus vallismortis]MCY8813682.1 hypothetical protein [Bacillus atrophaeus]MCY8820245.1 hypothetical protein [Bacillus atrophaeus]MCY8828631.1 hypothetical protein [Bacillus atrophaeus]MCY8832718.1 hypothetical protein [Bacillus atrophaeus]
MAVRDYIPFDKEEIPQQFEIDLADGTFVMRINYNQTDDSFSLDLFDLDMEEIVLGEKLILNVPLWEDIIDDRLPAPSLVPMDESNTETRVSAENFMKTVFLYIDDVGSQEADDGDSE